MANNKTKINDSGLNFEAADKMRGHRADSFRQDLHPDLKADFILAIS